MSRAPTCSLYFAYGSNLSIRRMQARCPAATPLHKFMLEDSKLVFRGVADCPRVMGSVCWGGLWRITAECEDSLDRYEGVHGGFYRKEYIPLPPGEFEDAHLMLYLMNDNGVFPPAQHYLSIIADGYRDFRLPMADLKEAVAHSHDHRNPSSHSLRRHTKHGRPSLATRPLLPGETESDRASRLWEPVTGPEREIEYDPPRRDYDREIFDRTGEWPKPRRKYPFGEPKRHNIDEWLEERRRNRGTVVVGGNHQGRDQFNLFDEWWHSPLTDND